ncbi:MAG TPA: rhomboid family intramembrane serine protease [Chitinophagaceae bacterium]|nr:rhomboid family intramembrane serine protease [Chitinophagaceae bacterium]
MSVTVVILVLTCVVSFVAFSNHDLINKLIFYPPAISHDKQWYRFFTCGFIHADIGHLAFNMISLFLFGEMVEKAFVQIFDSNGELLYIIMYVSALAVCLLPTYSKQKENYSYRSLGASGAVSAVVFAGILLFPFTRIGILFIPLVIPGYIFGPIYLIASAYMGKKGGDNINHSAHFWGALYGITFVIIMSVALTDFNPIDRFIGQVFH